MELGGGECAGMRAAVALGSQAFVGLEWRAHASECLIKKLRT